MQTVLLQSDGAAIGRGVCDVPAPAEGLIYTQVAAGGSHAVLLQSDGTAVACGTYQARWRLSSAHTSSLRCRRAWSTRRWPREAATPCCSATTARLLRAAGTPSASATYQRGALPTRRWPLEGATPSCSGSTARPWCAATAPRAALRRRQEASSRSRLPAPPRQLPAARGARDSGAQGAGAAQPSGAARRATCTTVGTSVTQASSASRGGSEIGAFGEPLKDGVLEKYGTSLLAGWQRRHFQLYPSWLAYAAEKQHRVKLIRLASISNVQLENGELHLTCEEGAKSIRHKLRAQTVAETKAWEMAIKSAWGYSSTE
ncbi:unnamed protein product [Prorocentrum cordatum]|uniref:PH domain-containing protein n=1 Tax=Prorocentrum cordatum TaxID=2364126 RepID=A0ABN9RJ85_9DINO|nr:unnamed protein product [Polarella glacialis]